MQSQKTFIFLILLLICSTNHLKAQFNDDGYHQHDGFYLSLSMGPVFGEINYEGTSGFQNPMIYKMSGTGLEMDIKIGGAIYNDIILHGTLISKALTGPTITDKDNNKGKAPDNVSVGEAMFGGGITYYYMPVNIFLSGSVGIGNFSLIDGQNNINASTQRGLAFQLKAGKEWWVSKNWGLGIAATYEKTNLTSTVSGFTEKFNSNRFGILFNATFN